MPLVLLRQSIVWLVLLVSVLTLYAALPARKLAAEKRLALAWSLGPWSWTLCVAALRLAGVSIVPAGLVATVAFAAFAAIRTIGSAGEPRARLCRPGTTPAVVGSVVLLGTFFLLHGGETRLWDSAFHAQIATFLERAPLPPENPFLAGRALTYPWFFDLETSALGALSGSTPFAVFAVVSLHAVAGLTLALALCVPPSVRSRRVTALVLVLAVWASNPLAYLFHLSRWFGGAIAGWDAVRQAASDFNLVLIQMSPWSMRSAGFPAHKFLEGTAFTQALGLVILAIHFSGAVARRFRWTDMAVLTAVFCALIHLQHGSAIALAPPIVVASGLLGFRAGGPDGAVRGAFATAAAFAAALVLSAVYLSWTLGARPAGVAAQTVQFGFFPSAAAAVALIGLPYAAIAVAGRAGTNRTEPKHGSMASVALPAAAILLFGCAVRIVGNNEEKILLPGAFLVPLATGPALERIRHRRRGLLPWAVGAFVAAALAGPMILVALASAWRPAPPYDPAPRVAALLATAPRGSILVSDRFAPERFDAAAYLCYPSLIGQWGAIDELRRREGAITRLKGAPLSRAVSLPAWLGSGWPEPIVPTQAGALEAIGFLGRPVVFVVPSGEWPHLPRASMRSLGEVDGWEVLLWPS